MIDGATRVYALLGDPVAHSLSPAMQNAAFRALGLRAVYVPLRCTSDDVPALMHALTLAGGGGNVTVPHKEIAAGAVARRSELAEAAGACNVFHAADGQLVGENTDVPGVLDALERLAPPVGPWLIAGTGGGARAAALAAGRRGAAVAACSRSDERRGGFERWARSHGITVTEPGACRVVINATPLGLAPDDRLPIEIGVAPEATVALDMVYAPGETRWVRAMRAAGLRAADGRSMLVAQGARALECWFPGVDAPVEIMRAVVNAELR